jgi:hypothetical protein
MAKYNPQSHVIHYNIYKKRWYLIPRERYQEYWNNQPSEDDSTYYNSDKLCDITKKLGLDE